MTKKRTLLLDTNLLILLVVGLYDPRAIIRFKRTNNQAFTEKDFELLEAAIEKFELLCTTPNILTEASNLLEGSPYFSTFQELIEKVLGEHLLDSKTVIGVDNKCFAKFGLSDAVIRNLADQENITVLTVDLPLYGYINSLGLNAFNFNHLRSGYLLE
jgi:hypothetical protein